MKCGKRRIRLFRLLTLALCAALLTGLLLPAAALAAENGERVIRIGWYESGGDEEPAQSTGAHGYDYVYLQALSQYTGWTYEYVRGTWNECLDRLENGEIDLLGFVSKTDARTEIFGYPNLPMAVTNAWLVISSEADMHIAVPEALDGMTVGLVAGNAYNADFDSYCTKRGIHMERREYGSLTDIAPALKSGEIDVAVVSDEDMTPDEHKLVRLSSNNQYYATSIHNQALLNELDEAMMQVHSYCPYLNSDLYQKYLSLNLEGKPSFTAAELEFIEHNPTITVLVDSGWPPVEYYDEESETYKGIFPDMYALLSEKCGITFALVGDTSGGNLADMRSGEYRNLLTSISYDYAWAEQNDVYVTQPFVASQIVKLGKNLDAENPTVAINEAAYFTFALAKELEGINTISYPKQAQRLEAVRTGAADHTFVTEDQANYYRSQPRYADLQIEKMLGYEQKVCISIGKNCDPELMSIISKALASVTHDEQTAILRNNTTTVYEWTLGDFLYAYRVPCIIIVILLMIVITSLIAFFCVNKRRTRKELQRSRRMERYIGYLCDMYYKVLEVDLDLGTRTQYMKRKGVVEMEERDDFTAFAIDSIHPEDVDACLSVFDPSAVRSLSAAGENERYVECRMRSEGGAYRWYSFLLKRITQDAEHPCSAMLLIKDIDDLHREREQNQDALVTALDAANSASRSKSAFLSSMSHEIRTPLNAMIGYMTIAQNAIENQEKVQHCIESAGIAARHLLSIINDVLDISSIESGKMKLTKARFDLKELLSNVTSIFYQQCKQKGVTFVMSINGLTEEWVVGDAMRVNQILMNLMSNAVKFTESGGSVNMTVVQTTMNTSQVFIRFIVKDTGIGMSKEYLGRLFTPFEQESAEIARKYGGTGLGMSITFNMVSLMGGKIDVSSKEGEGSTFTVTLPFERTENKEIRAISQDMEKLHVLVVDDLENECDYVHALLTRCGVPCETVQSGEEAVRLVASRKDKPERFDMCIIDWNMPGLDGLATTRLIHEECDPDIPIIIATAYDISEFEEAAMAAGAAKIIAKPLFQSTLFDLLVSTCGRYETMLEDDAEIPDLKGMRVLLAEDNEMNVDVAVDLLGLAGIQTDVARNGQEALDMFLAAKDDYDVILMDVQMPVMDGYAATKAIRASAHPQARSLPIIAMTANAFAEDVSASLASGMNGHLCKPIETTELFSTLRRIGRNKP